MVVSLVSLVAESPRRMVSEVTPKGRLIFFSLLVNDGNSFIVAEYPAISSVRKGEGEGRACR